jgi:hypothetical protein
MMLLVPKSEKNLLQPLTELSLNFSLFKVNVYSLGIFIIAYHHHTSEEKLP